MIYPIYIDTIIAELSILYFKGLPSFMKWCISVPEDCFILANSADPDEMPPYMPEYLFTEIQNEKD